MAPGDETQPLLAPREGGGIRCEPDSISPQTAFGLIAVAAAILLLAHSTCQCTRKFVPTPRAARYQCPPQHPKIQPLPGFSSYLSNSDPSELRTIRVTYDARSIRINDEPTILLAGSMHPVRATRSTWDRVLDHAIDANLNMITVYLMWSYHQPVSSQEIDWTLPGGGWDVASGLWEAACRGLYVHIRIGPYVCAEYDYGGIPSWVPLVYGGEADDDTMSMRRPNRQWMEAMKVWVDESVGYLTENQLFAHQGGPIILAQIENELGGDVDPETENLLPNQTLQDYADWCGEVGDMAQPNVVWTMCNGLSSNQTINTCNGYGEGGACSTRWLEEHGQSGRIQIDQPALWTENEMGFQIWGDAPSNTSDYFWGRTARDVAADCLRWFARGGTHLNTYMFWGGYNRGRTSGASIMNAYATDAIICPNTQPRQPKFDHLQELHRTIAFQLANVLVTAPTALGKEMRLEYRNVSFEGSVWRRGTKQVAFQYRKGSRTILFVENNSPLDVDVRVPIIDPQSSRDTTIVRMVGWSATVFDSGKALFNSSHIDDGVMYGRTTREAFQLENWTSWREPRGATSPSTISDVQPWEHTRILLASNASSDYIWYTTSFKWYDVLVGEAILEIETQKATAVSAFLEVDDDEMYLGSIHNHEHKDGNCTFNFTFPGRLLAPNSAMINTVHILIESLGYNNLIGRWGSSSSAKTKGITGNVWIKGKETHESMTRCLNCGQQWFSQAGLNGRSDGDDPSPANERHGGAGAHSAHPCSWSSATFTVPSKGEFHTDQELLLRLVAGRGEVWLNGESLGRYWNITRRPPAPPGQLSQEYYHLPRDVLKVGGRNSLLFFNAIGGDVSHGARLVSTGLAPSKDSTFRDEIDCANACL